MPKPREELKKSWSERITKQLVGKKIKSISYMTEEEVNAKYWSRSAVVIELEDGTCLFPSSDDEGNEAGAIFTTLEELQIIPVI